MVFVRLVVVWLVAISVMHVLLIFVAVVHVEVGVVVRILPLRFVVFLVPVHGVVVDCSGNSSGSPRYPPSVWQPYCCACWRRSWMLWRT